MQSLNGRRIKNVRVHQTTLAPGIGNIGPSIDENSGKTLGAAKLYYQDGGCLFVCKSTELYIPGGNIVSMVLDANETIAQPVLKVK